MRKHLSAALIVLGSAIPAFAQADFGNRIQGGPYDVLVFVENASCPGTHQVRVSVTGAPWLTLKEPTTVSVAEGQTESVRASLDIRTTAAGPQTGTITFTCLDCDQNTCRQSTTSTAVTVRVLKAVATFGDNAADANFGGLVAGKPVDICTLLANVLGDIAKTGWGSGPRGAKIIAKLNAEYMDGNCSDVTFVGNYETADAKGRPTQQKDSADEQPPAGNASYVRTPRVYNPITGNYSYSEEIYVGLDETLVGIECARGNPGAYYVFMHNGRMGVVKKEDLVHTIIHEGLHALNGGNFNVAKPNGGTGASLEEENDGFKAGDEACTAMGLPTTGGSAGKGYNAGSNPAYTPVK